MKYDALGRTIQSGRMTDYAGAINWGLLDDLTFPDKASENLDDISTTVYDTIRPMRFSGHWQDNLRGRVVAAVREVALMGGLDYDDGF